MKEFQNLIRNKQKCQTNKQKRKYQVISFQKPWAQHQNISSCKQEILCTRQTATISNPTN